MDNYYVVSSGSYSDYHINFIFKSPTAIRKKVLRGYYLESIKRSAEFEDRQIGKLANFFNSDYFKSTNYFKNFHGEEEQAILSYEEWGKICEYVGVEENPHDWLQKILTENGCEILKYKEFNIDDWD